MYTSNTHFDRVGKKIRLNLTHVSPSKKIKLWWQCWPLTETYAWKIKMVKTSSQSFAFRETTKDHPSHTHSKIKPTSTLPQSHPGFMKPLVVFFFETFLIEKHSPFLKRQNKIISSVWCIFFSFMVGFQVHFLFGCMVFCLCVHFVWFVFGWGEWKSPAISKDHETISQTMLEQSLTI